MKPAIDDQIRVILAVDREIYRSMHVELSAQIPLEARRAINKVKGITVKAHLLHLTDDQRTRDASRSEKIIYLLRVQRRFTQSVRLSRSVPNVDSSLASKGLISVVDQVI